MKIMTLETSVSNAFQLGPRSEPMSAAPPEVQHQVTMGQHWHLIGWVDETRKTAGICRKGRVIAFPWPCSGANLIIVRPAKGPGCIDLVAVPPSGRNVSVLSSQRYSESALLWLQAHLDALTDVLGCRPVIKEGGSDY